MANLTLDNSEMQDINTLLSLGFSIIETENELAYLEANYEKQSPCYKSALVRLKSTLSLENAIFNRLNLTPEKCIAIFLEYGNPNNFLEQMENLINNNEKELAKNRLLNKIFSDLKSKSESNSSIKCIAINSNTYNQSFFDPHNIFKLEEALKTDIFNCIITFLTTEINKCHDTETRRILTEKKYKLAFFNPSYEETLINSEYELGELYLASQTYAELLHLDKSLHDSLMFQFTRSLFELSAEPLSNSTDYDINTKYASIIFYKVLLKTCLLLDTSDIEKTLRQQLSFQLDIICKQKNAGVDIVLEILDHTKNDKQIPKVISLKLKRES